MRRGVASNYRRDGWPTWPHPTSSFRYACVEAYAASGDGAAFVVALFAVDGPELIAVIEAGNLNVCEPVLRAQWLRSISPREGASWLGVMDSAARKQKKLVTCSWVKTGPTMKTVLRTPPPARNAT